MFKRQNKRGIFSKVRNYIYPEMGLKRTLAYYGFKMIRIKASSHSIAFGFSLGVFVSFGPFIGLHTICSFIFAFIFRCNLIATLLGSLVGNPWTFPALWWLEYKIGNLILNTNELVDTKLLKHMKHHLIHNLIHSLKKGDIDVFVEHIFPVIKPLLLGSIPVAIISAVALYQPIKILINKARLKYKQTPQIATANDNIKL